MPLRGGKAKAGALVKPVVKKPIGNVRRAQQITTYGVGSLVALGDQSFIVSGLDSWKDDPLLAIDEPRLQRALRVAGFRYPPADDPSSGHGITVRRFPDWYSCRNCHDLQPYRRFESVDGHCVECGAKLTPSRFVVACANGHIDDFPYWQWVHKRKEPREGAKHNRLKLYSTAQTASLQAIRIQCECGEEASLEGAFGRSALDRLGIRCTGARPWLGRGSEEDCSEMPRTLQRGSSAAWFPLVRSALSIPPWNERIQRAIMETDFFGMVMNTPDLSDAQIKRMAAGNSRLAATGYTPEQILEAVRRRERLIRDSGESEAEVDVLFEANSDLRKEEFHQLCNEVRGSEENIEFECVPPAEAGESPRPAGIGRIMLVNRLREVRALTGFMRVDIPMPSDPKSRRAPLSSDRVAWLPAVEVNGEGVFLCLDEYRLHAWERKVEVLERAAIIRARHVEALKQRAANRAVPSPVTARFILVHTLAHILIDEWSLDAGYPAGALRERLYVDEDEMAGLLIYTATSDSAGSLGGVVSQGVPKQMETALRSALDRTAWCSADPLCIEAEASGSESLNLAACHACVLLPETSCELGNTILDRAMLIGTPEASSIGFFTEGR